MLTTPWFRINKPKEYIRNKSRNILPSYIMTNLSRDPPEVEILMEAFEIKIEGLRPQWKLLASGDSNLERVGGPGVGNLDH